MHGIKGYGGGETVVLERPNHGRYKMSEEKQ